jgi:hypothetical protein
MYTGSAKLCMDSVLLRLQVGVARLWKEDKNRCCYYYGKNHFFPIFDASLSMCFFLLSHAGLGETWRVVCPSMERVMCCRFWRESRVALLWDGLLCAWVA